MEIKPGNPHRSEVLSRGYVERDPIIKLADGTKIPGQHGIMDVRAEIACESYEAGMLNTKVVKDILNP